jgi:hypothetical protein
MSDHVILNDTLCHSMTRKLFFVREKNNMFSKLKSGIQIKVLYCYGMMIPVMEQCKLSKGNCCGFLLGFCM